MTLPPLSNPLSTTQTIPFHCHPCHHRIIWDLHSPTRIRSIKICGLYKREQDFFAQNFASHKRNLKHYVLASALSNGHDQTETGSWGTFDDHAVLFPLGDVDSFEHSDSEAELSKIIEHSRNKASLLDKVKAIQLHVLASEQWNASQLKLCHRNYLVSATNLIHYIAFRCLDVGQLKEELSSIGLLSLESINSSVFASITTSIHILENLMDNSLKRIEEENAKEILNQKIVDHQSNVVSAIETMKMKASLNRKLLLGSLQDSKTNYIMVTVGQEATESEELIPDLINAGASVIRINCAHGSPTLWSEIIKRVKENSQMLEKPCRILMDLAGPKLRVGKLNAGPSFLKITPHKIAAGDVIFPAQVWLSHKGTGPPTHLSVDEVLFMDENFLNELEIGDTLRFSDARGKKRTLKISGKFYVFSGTGYVAECTRTAYVRSGTEFRLKRRKGRSLVGQVVHVPAKEPFIRLRVGDLLIISRDEPFEQHELYKSRSGTYRVTCSSGYLFDSVKLGDPIAFDDGKIWGVINGTSISEVVVTITHASPKGTKLKSEKSINIPQSNFQFEGLTTKDIMDLEFVAGNADMVGISFVRNVGDIVVIHQQLEKQKHKNLGIVLKIETNSGFDNLALLLLEAMKLPNPLGVMIARGDLAVECGWEKLADLQEEILSLCGAAHIPVIWATQVLESLVKSGVPTRAEITDAASGRRASCIMLNKGKHIVKAVSTLDQILHQRFTKMQPFYHLVHASNQQFSP